MSERAGVTGTTRRHLRITGRVQGVFYRASAQTEARRLGLVGWVRNVPDGSVELEAEGPADAVDALVRWCHRGPPAARVDDVMESSQPPLATERDFAVRR